MPSRLNLFFLRRTPRAWLTFRGVNRRRVRFSTSARTSPLFLGDEKYSEASRFSSIFRKITLVSALPLTLRRLPLASWRGSVEEFFVVRVLSESHVWNSDARLT